ncbi:FAD-dependent monooxygenase [Rhodoplanes sp. Z2-YC6860]|uniref:FAD-dependent monooxygenase n=1 Tax=Rhodoplanes sp. Z2-YC6860 TaxID=674703 RepID=UPI00078B96D2|nr:FAD-dependent monooxygenase [Rhodoplanes sp. Z2-YC6860]AMN39275.1 2-polyprenyl-6-methoxyphenol hydroxylase-like oxidoreductase [Rhodoplanes sp. Z2-YC6860]
MGLKIGINGGGVGGMAAAIALRQAGHDVLVFEQASSFARVGADINLTPNSVRALAGLGVVAALEQTAARPTHRISRMWDSGQETSRLEMADTAQQRYGAPQLTIHRADLIHALKEKLPADVIRLGRRVVAIGLDHDKPSVSFADGSRETVDVLVGADGIHSPTRTALFGPEHPQFTGLVSYRSVVDSSRLSIPNMEAFTKWWGPTPDLQIVTFPLNRGRETFVFSTTPQKDWLHESWTMAGDVNELRAAYVNFHPEARALLDACTEVVKSALYVRDPLPRWSSGCITLLGDACHPMTPFMAQGAAMAIEDAVVLGRAMTGVGFDGVKAALARYEHARRDRTARVQLGSRGNEWLKEGGNADWVYAYDAWSEPLVA